MDHQAINESRNGIHGSKMNGSDAQSNKNEVQLPQIKVEEDLSSQPIPSIHSIKDDDNERILPKTAPPLGMFNPLHMQDAKSNSLDSNFSPELRRRTGLRADRVESSWEDISSDEDSDTNTINLQMAQIRADRSTSSTPTRRSMSLLLDHEDQWEDEDAIVDGSDSEDSQTTAETAHSRSRGRHGSSKLRAERSTAIINGQSSSASEDDNIRSTPQGRSSRLPRRNSAQRALREYRNSKLALLQSESDNVARYNRIMRGETADVGREEEKPSRELRRADTIDLLDRMDPFSASIGTESVDDADTSARAHDIRLRADHRHRDSVDSPARPPSHSRRSSQNVSLRSPRLPLRKLSTSPIIKTIPLPQDPIDDSHASFSEEQYASVPASPAEHTANGNEWLPANDRGKETSTNNTANLKVETPSADGIQSSRRSSKNADTNTASNHPSTGKGGENHLRSDLISAQLDQLAEATPPFSLWDYLKEEIMASDFDSTQEMKWERVTNFIAIPFWMEKIMFFGFFVCLDSFLYTFTILPIRFLVAIYCVVSNFIVWIAGGPRRYLSSSHKCDILKSLLIIMSCWILSRITDASKMYHSVRGQDVVKLYVIFNVLEIADRLCCSFGQDLLDSLFSRSTLARRKDGHQPYLRPLGFFALSLLYVLAHTLVLLYQLVTLNVAINSYDNALLTLLLSNQFVEIKGSVFKKFEKENLFQLTCADIVERFQLTLMLCSIGLRNLIEVAGAAGNSVAALTPPAAVPEIVEEVMSNVNTSKFSSPLSAIAILGALPTSFTVFPSFSLLETIFTPVCIVLASEFVVDWLKHAFITKFNHIRPSVYGRFMDVLCRDLVMAGPVVRSSSSRRKHTFVDQSPVVSRRLGFAAVPLACLLVRMASQVMGMLHDDSHFDECAVPEWHKHAAEAAAMANNDSLLSLIWNTLRRPIELILTPLVNNPKITLDLALYYIWSTATWILTITIAWFFLVALKLILGTNLVSFASNRYATMGQREKEEELNARDRQPIGVDKDEMAYDAKVSQLIDKKDDDASRMGLAGQPIPTPAKYQSGKSNKNSESLMDVSRYTMVRSRIW